MKLLIVCGLVAAVVADRLDNTYLPPSHARTSGGNGNVLNAPFGGGPGSGFGSGAASKNYLPPNTGFARAQGNGNGPSGNIGNTGFGQKPNGFGVSSGASQSNRGFSGSFGSSAGSNGFGIVEGNLHGASGNAGQGSAFGQKSTGFGNSAGIGSHTFNTAGSLGSNVGLVHKSNNVIGSSPGTFGSASGFKSNTGSFGGHSNSGSGHISGNIGASGFKQSQSSQYGTPSAAYGVPSGAGFKGAPSRDAGAAIVRSNNENFGDGSYRFDFETENKISHNEAGELKNIGSDFESSSVQGSYTYIGDDGKSYAVNYIADENGFQPIGDHIPTSPPIPEAIQRSLATASQGSSLGGHQPGFQSHGGSFQSASRQYLAPNKPTFNSQTGYQY